MCVIFIRTSWKHNKSTCSTKNHLGWFFGQHALKKVAGKDIKTTWDDCFVSCRLVLAMICCIVLLLAWLSTCYACVVLVLLCCLVVLFVSKIFFLEFTCQWLFCVLSSCSCHDMLCCLVVVVAVYVLCMCCCVVLVLLCCLVVLFMSRCVNLWVCCYCVGVILCVDVVVVVLFLSCGSCLVVV